MPLHHAISNNFNIKVVHRLLEMKARPDEMVFGVTPLLRASLKGNFELTILLLENNASTKFTVEEGMLQPLDAACLIPDPIIAAKVVEQLLLGGTDPDYINFIGCKPIEIAANAGNRKAVEYLFSDTTVLETWDPNITWDVDAIMSYYANTDINSKLLAYIWRLLELGDTELIGGEESDNLQRACHHYYHALLLYRDFPTGPPYELVICKLSRCLLKLKDAYWALAEAEECMRCLHSGAPEGTKAKEDFVLRHPKRVFIAELSFCIAKASHYMKRHEKALIFYEYARFVDDKEEYLRGHEICLEETKNGLYSCAGASTSTSGT